MTSQHRPTKILTILKEELPQCFKKGNDKIPLMQGIHLEVIAHYQNDPRLSSTAIRHAVRFYVSSNNYLKKLIKGTARINLKGQRVSVVSAHEENNAKIQISKRKNTKKHKAF